MSNVKVLDKSIPNELMEEKNAHTQTMYNVQIPANTLTTGSKLRITANISKGGGTTVPTANSFKSNRVFCSSSNQQAIIGVSNTGEVFDPTSYMGGGDGENRIIHLTSSIDGTKTAGVCYTRTCCPVFETQAELDAYRADPSLIYGYPTNGAFPSGMNGVFNQFPGGEYGPPCTYTEVWFKINNILEGNPVFGSMVYIRPGSTINNMTGYGIIYDSKYHKLSIRMWKNQSMITYEGHKLFDIDYTAPDNSFIYAVIDCSYFSFDPVWLTKVASTRYPYIYFYVDDFASNIILEKIWSPRLAEGALSWYGTNSFSFNKPFDQLLGPEFDMYTGLCVLGEDVSGTCMSKAEIQQFNIICGLCYAGSGLNYLDISNPGNNGSNKNWSYFDWTCTDWTWF